MQTETLVPGSICEEELIRLVDAYSGVLLGLCRLTLGDTAMAQDIVQETFLKAWRSIGRFEAKNGCSARTWITRIAGNTCRDYLKRSWYKHESRLISPEDLKKLGNAPEEERELIMDVMHLPEKYRQVLLLVSMQGMTIREAAECMQTSTATIFRRLEKARQMIA